MLDLLELARNISKMPLPKSITGPGIPLSPYEDTLISLNYQLAISRRPLAQADEEMEENEDLVNPNQNSNLNPSQEQKTDQQQTSPQRVSFPLARNVQGEIKTRLFTVRLGFSFNFCY
ncbi:hypothetical protein MKX01_035572 [Papaver californicum]|nr:hypothetical protein MKX01_035572 [Papaver californicum]